MTASKVSKIVRSREENLAAVAEAMYSQRVLKAKAILWGKSNERVAIAAFQKASGVNIHGCGLLVDPNHPFLGASPDGICDSMILEVKCSYSIGDKFITPENYPHIARD